MKLTWILILYMSDHPSIHPQGAPKEGLPIIDPYADILDDEGTTGSEERGDDEKIPVGSLRFLRNQAEMESDMNSKRVLAGREMTGDSGILSEVGAQSYCCLLSHIW